MSSGEKLARGKSKKPVPKTKNTKGKEVPINDQRFRGEGVKFKCKLVGTTDVNSARGDAMCAEAIKKLKVQALKLNKESGEHKLRIVMYVTIKGIRIVDEKTQKVVHEHPINKISFITHDPEDKKIFGYVCSQPCTTGHKLFAIKSEKAAGVVTGTLYELFQVVFQLRQQAGLTKKAPNSAPVSNGPSPQESDGIYEVPYKNGNNKQAKASPQVDHEYAEPIKTETKKDPHYKVPKNQLVQAALPPIPVETNKDVEVGEKTATADVLNSSTLLSQSSMDKDPDQVSQASMEVPFTTHDNSGAEMAFFGSSVFDSTPAESAAADTVSVASADVAVLRSGSVSSGSSESHSLDTRSVHSRSGSLLNQTGSATPNQTEGFQAEFATAFEDKLDVEPSLGSEVKQEEQEVIPAAIPTTNEASTEDAPPVMKTLAVFESPPDPFASSDISTNERTQPVASENFFSESFAAFGTAFNNNEVKSNEENSKKDDPFASSSGAQEKGNAFDSAKRFASETSFEAAFGSEQFTPSADDATVDNNQTQEETGDKKTVNEKSEENSAANFSWENAFGETKTATQPETAQSSAASEVKFSWTESFASDDVEPSVKTGPSTSASVTWDDAFGGAADTGSSNQAPDAFSWDDAFGGMTADSNNQQPESTAFGDAFAPSSTVSSSDVSSVSEQSTQPALQSTLPSDPELSATPKVPEDDVPSEPQPSATENPQLFRNDQFTIPTSSQAQDSTASVAGIDHEEPSNPPSLLKDPFEGLGINFHASTPGKMNKDDTQKSPESETGSGNEEDLFAKENVPSELPSEENPKDANNVKEVEERLTQPEEQIPEEDKMDEKETSEVPEVRPSELQIQESTPSLSECPVSPTAPPPLPPRPAASAPPLPARPSSSSSTTSAGRSPISPRTSIGSPASNSPHHGKKGSAKKPPPALPPRVDLHEKSVNSSSDEKEAFPDPFGSDFFDQKFNDNKVVSEGGNSDWAASWPSAQKTSEEKSKDQNSDPFSEDFFTNFDFPQKGASSISTKSDNVDPFAATNPSSGVFPSAFGNEDLFAAFTPAKGETVFGSGDPFSNDLSDSFAAFSSEDPFSDISDPFADKGVLSDDPFGDSPRKPQPGKAITLNESLVASDEADSFA